VASILIHSRDHQYGEYLKCLAQQVDLVQDFQILDAPSKIPLQPGNVPGLVVMHAEEGCCDYQEPLVYNNKVPVIVVASGWDKGRGISGDNIVSLAKPLDAVKFVQSVHECCSRNGNNPGQDREPAQPYLLGSTPEMMELRRKIARVSSSDLAVLICGQTGTGKGVAAQALHNSSRQRGNQLLYLNCANVPNSLLESELFGYKKGAFTGAWQDKPGMFQHAGEGTIFLDEISEMSPFMQAKLLHVLQEKEFYPVGSTSSVQINSRIVAATNADLDEAISAGRFREDLYYRLAVVRLDMPPLRRIKQDVPLMMQYFLDKYCLEYNKPEFPGPSPALLDLVQEYDWPGNVRELESCVMSLVAMENEDMVREDLYRKMPAMQECSPGRYPASAYLSDRERCSSLKEATEKAVIQAESELISKALIQAMGKKKLAAAALKVSYKSLLKKIKAYRL